MSHTVRLNCTPIASASTAAAQVCLLVITHDIISPHIYYRFRFVGWAYIRVINDPLLGVGISSGVGIFSRDWHRF